MKAHWIFMATLFSLVPVAFLASQGRDDIVLTTLAILYLMVLWFIRGYYSNGK